VEAMVALGRVNIISRCSKNAKIGRMRRRNVWTGLLYILYVIRIRIYAEIEKIERRGRKVIDYALDADAELKRKTIGSAQRCSRRCISYGVQTNDSMELKAGGGFGIQRSLVRIVVTKSKSFGGLLKKRGEAIGGSR